MRYFGHGERRRATRRDPELDALAAESQATAVRAAEVLADAHRVTRAFERADRVAASGARRR